MIHIKDLSLSFKAQKIYDHVSLAIQSDDRIGLVGRNGTGKSTLLKLIAEAAIHNNPAITVSHKKSIAYFPQEVVLQSDKSIFDETFSCFTKINELIIRQEELELYLEKDSGNADYIEEYASVANELMLLQPTKMKAEVHELLIGLGFKPEQLSESVATLSVGWKMRIVLAKLLLQKADFYLFDEPTNHLDIVAKEWFLQFLKRASFGFILVCHERYFLNELCTKIIELEYGKAKMYTGNYDHYEQQKEHAVELIEAAYLQQQKEIQAKQAIIDRFRAQATKAKMVQSMIKALDKIERIELPHSSKNVTIHFPVLESSARIVLTVKNLSFSFGQKVLFKNVNFEVERGDKIALIAPNGVGKTTLFSIITGAYPVQQGTVTLGNKVSRALFDQDQTSSLPLHKTILQAIEESCPKASSQIIRNMLGAFLFTHEDVHKKIEVLSGGEKNRVGMVKVLLHNANFLLLDEPTNHLDMQSKEILLKALQAYQGTILFVSHDQDFINRLATKIIELTPQGTIVYQGNYDLYLYQKQNCNAQSTLQKSKKDVKNVQSVERVDQKKIKDVERKIHELENAIKKIEQSFATIAYGTPEFQQAQRKIASYTREHEHLLLEWEGLHTDKL